MCGHLAKMRGTVRYNLSDPRGSLERRQYRTLQRAHFKRHARREIADQRHDQGA